MAKLTASQKAEFVAGQVHALLGFAIAVMMTHPDPKQLAQDLDLAGEETLKRAKKDKAPNAYIDGMKDVRYKLDKSINGILRI